MKTLLIFMREREIDCVIRDFRSFVSFSFRSLTRGDLDIYVGVVFAGVLLTIGGVRRGVNAIGVRGVAIELTIDGVC